MCTHTQRAPLERRIKVLWQMLRHLQFTTSTTPIQYILTRSFSLLLFATRCNVQTEKYEGFYLYSSLLLYPCATFDTLGHVQTNNKQTITISSSSILTPRFLFSGSFICNTAVTHCCTEAICLKLHPLSRHLEETLSNRFVVGKM